MASKDIRPEDTLDGNSECLLERAHAHLYRKRGNVPNGKRCEYVEDSIRIE
jgi:hypothetical protein